jgi:hypothetical protein
MMTLQTTPPTQTKETTMSTFTILNTAAASPATAYAHEVEGLDVAHKAAAFLSRHQMGVFAVKSSKTVLAFYCGGQRVAAKPAK